MLTLFHYSLYRAEISMLKMNLFAIAIIACSVSICQAYPHGHDKQPDQDDYDFIDLIASIAAAIILDDVSDEIESLSPSELMACVSQDYRKHFYLQCEAECVRQPNYVPAMTAECLLVKMEALDNVTGLVDMASLKANTLLSIDSLTAEQQVLGLASLESCVESNFTLPNPPPFVTVANTTADQLFHNLGKYDTRNNPMRIMVCVANALIENGCFSDSILNKLVVAPESDKSLNENSPPDGNDDEIVSGASKEPIDFAL